MTRMPKITLVAATFVGLGLISAAGGGMQPQPEAALAVPFWQLQGAGPTSPSAIEAVVEMRALARQTVVAAR